MLAKDLNGRDVRTWLGGYFWLSTQTSDKHLGDLPVNWNLENKLRKTVAPCSATLAVVWLCSCAKKYQQKQSQCWMQASTGPEWLQQHKTTWARQAGRQAGSGVMRNIEKGKYCRLAFWMLPPLAARETLTYNELPTYRTKPWATLDHLPCFSHLYASQHVQQIEKTMLRGSAETQAIRFKSRKCRAVYFCLEPKKKMLQMASV